MLSDSHGRHHGDSVISYPMTCTEQQLVEILSTWSEREKNVLRHGSLAVPQ